LLERQAGEERKALGQLLRRKGLMGGGFALCLCACRCQITLHDSKALAVLLLEAPHQPWQRVYESHHPIHEAEDKGVQRHRQQRSGQDQIEPLQRQQAVGGAESHQDEGELPDLRQRGGGEQRGTERDAGVPLIVCPTARR